MQAGIGIAGDDEGRAVVVALLDGRADQADDLLDMRLAFDTGRAVLQGDALDRRAAFHAQRFHGDIDAFGHGFGGVGVDDQDAVGSRLGHAAEHGL